MAIEYGKEGEKGRKKGKKDSVGWSQPKAEFSIKAAFEISEQGIGFYCIKSFSLLDTGANHPASCTCFLVVLVQLLVP